MNQRKRTGKGKAQANIVLPQANLDHDSEGEAFDLDVSDTSSVGPDSNKPTKAPTTKAPTTARGGRAATTAAPVQVAIAAPQLESKLHMRLLVLVSSLYLHIPSSAAIPGQAMNVPGVELLLPTTGSAASAGTGRSREALDTSYFYIKGEIEEKGVRSMRKICRICM